MAIVRAAFLLVLLGGVVAACASVPAAEPETVRALRYRRLYYDTDYPIDMDGRMLEEIWFPERGVLCNVTKEYAFESEPGTETITDIGDFPVLHAWYGAILNRYPTTRLSGTEITAPTEEIRVPRALAERIFRMAEMDRERKATARPLGKASVDAGVLRLAPDTSSPSPTE